MKMDHHLPLIVAEFGSSPAREAWDSKAMAYRGWNLEPWCQSAHQVGADAVKIQLWRVEHFPIEEQKRKRRLEFPMDKLSSFVKTAHDLYLLAGASVFDEEAVRLASEHCDFIKLAAREQYNSDLIFKAFSQNKQVMRSVSDLAFRAGHSNTITTLFAVQVYPTPIALALYWLIRFSMHCKRSGYRWGWSSHTRSALDCVVAARLGASVIEKHFALMPEDIEAGHSLLPDAFGRMVRDIRR